MKRLCTATIFVVLTGTASTVVYFGWTTKVTLLDNQIPIIVIGSVLGMTAVSVGGAAALLWRLASRVCAALRNWAEQKRAD